MKLFTLVLLLGCSSCSLGFIISHGCFSNSMCQHGGTCHEWRCQCRPEYTGDYCEHTPAPTTHTPPSTTPVPTTRSVATTTPVTASIPVANTTPVPTTTTIATTTELHMYTDTPHCAKYNIVFDIADTVISHNALASVCPTSGNRSSPEAFVLNHCNLTIKDPMEWKKGYPVMTNCAALPAFTPVIEKFGDEFNPGTHRSGIFLECLPEPEGFKMVYQRCDSIPIIEHVKSDEAMLFYTVK